MKLEAFLIGFVIFSLFIVGGTFIIGDINSNYHDVMDENISTADFGDTYDTIDDMYNISQDQKSFVLGAELDEDNIVDSSYKGTFGAVRLVKNTFKLFGNIVNDIADVLHVPTFFITFLMTAITIAVIFGIISVVLRFKE